MGGGAGGGRGEWAAGGGGVGAGGGWEAEGGLNHPLAQRKSRCVLSKAQNSHSAHVRTRRSLGTA